jgi:hypothetical protein
MLTQRTPDGLNSQRYSVIKGYACLHGARNAKSPDSGEIDSPSTLRALIQRILRSAVTPPSR